MTSRGVDSTDRFGLDDAIVGSSDAFEAWIPGDYLREYYGEVQQDERQTIRYFVEQMRGAPPGPVLCFGCGPTLHHVFLTAPYTVDLSLADYLPRNLEEIDRWRRGAADAHDWRPFVRYTLACESGREPSDDEVALRMSLVRQRIARLLPADATQPDPLGPEYRGRFATVISAFCADSITGDKGDWARYSRNIATLVAPGGLLLIAALRRCQWYKVGDRTFASADIDETDLQRVLQEDFRSDSVAVDVHDVPDHRDQGFAGILHARARKD